MYNQTLKESTIEYLPFDLIQGVRELKENELKFKENYYGKYIETSGKISIFAEADGQSFVALDLGNEFLFDFPYFYFKSSEKDKLLNLKKGDTVKVRGRLSLTLGMITVWNCEIVE